MNILILHATNLTTNDNYTDDGVVVDNGDDGNYNDNNSNDNYNDDNDYDNNVTINSAMVAIITTVIWFVNLLLSYLYICYKKLSNNHNKKQNGNNMSRHIKHIRDLMIPFNISRR